MNSSSRSNPAALPSLMFPVITHLHQINKSCLSALLYWPNEMGVYYAVYNYVPALVFIISCCCWDRAAHPHTYVNVSLWHKGHFHSNDSNKHLETHPSVWK